MVTKQVFETRAGINCGKLTVGRRWILQNYAATLSSRDNLEDMEATEDTEATGEDMDGTGEDMEATEENMEGTGEDIMGTRTDMDSTKKETRKSHRKFVTSTPRSQRKTTEEVREHYKKTK